MAQLRAVKIFLSTPSDLIEERKKFKTIIDNVNGIITNSMGLVLLPKVWEDIPPQSGRPQSAINPSLEEADIVIFALWKRWGTPTGYFSSGIEEEYEYSIQNNKSIMMYFRKVDESTIEDASISIKC